MNYESDPVAIEISKLDPQSAKISDEVSHQLSRFVNNCGDDEGFVNIEDHKWLNGELNFEVRLGTNNKDFYLSNQ